uniref:Putative secreted protein n=1 Tax=Anopheles marajoara TaxID=58244 RepID=A0A2M4C8L3_9DIPT
MRWPFWLISCFVLFCDGWITSKAPNKERKGIFGTTKGEETKYTAHGWTHKATEGRLNTESEEAPPQIQPDHHHHRCRRRRCRRCRRLCNMFERSTQDAATAATAVGVRLILGPHG